MSRSWRISENGSKFVGKRVSIHPSSPAASLDGVTEGWSRSQVPSWGGITSPLNARGNLHIPDPQGVRTQNLSTLSPCICDQTQQMRFCLSRVALLDLMKVPDYLLTVRGAPLRHRYHLRTAFSGPVSSIRTQSSDPVYVPRL